MTFVNVSGQFMNTIHRMDYHILEEINEVVQTEPSMEGEPGHPRGAGRTGANTIWR